jgi:polar amino acid transport system substrate-binding protein
MRHPTHILREFAPHSVLRVALNHGNQVLVRRDDAGTPQGISVDLAAALAAHLGLDLRLVSFERSVDVSSSAADDLWDVCFLAVDPDRANSIAFAQPYVRIEGCYLAGPQCDAADSHALARAAVPVGVVRGSAYTLTLQRSQGAEHLVLFETSQDALDALDGGEVPAIAGIRPAMERAAQRRSGCRILTPPFMEIRQAMAMPQGRPKASAVLSGFLGEMLRLGKVGDILELHGVDRSCAILPGSDAPRV